MLKVALTGGIGSGKSRAGAIFESLGAIVVDSDQLSREVIDRGTPGFDEVLKAFGDEVLSNGEIDRKKLAQLIFEDSGKRAILEKIVHPKVREAFNKLLSEVPADALVINQIPLLVETNGASNFDAVVTVSTPLTTRKERLISKGLKSYEIDRRIAAQVSDSEREAIADYIIDNSGDELFLQGQVERIFEELKHSASGN